MSRGLGDVYKRQVLDPDKMAAVSSKSADDAQPQPVAVAEPAVVAAPTTDHDAATATAQDYQLTPALVQARQIDPMIGMQGITPQQFMPSL